ncbi:MAG: hypothetical protein VW397_00730 [Candidatus Margulisiibacteriota bacterium]
MKLFFKSVYGLLGILLSIYFVLGVGFRTPWTKRVFHDYLTTKFETQFNQSIEIGKVSGDVFRGLVIEDIVIPTNNAFGYVLKAKQVNVDFKSNLNFLNWAHFIKRIDVVGLDINIIRSTDKQLNIQHYLRLINSGMPPGDRAYRLAIYFDQVKGNLIDYRGWGKLPSYFQTSFNDGSGSILIDSQNGTNMTWHFLPDHSAEKSRLTAKLNGTSFKYQFQANALKTNAWSPYFVPFPSVKIRDDVLHVRGVLQNKTDQIKSHLPFYFHIDIDFDYLNVSLPKFSSPLTNTNGALVFTNKNGTTLSFENTFSYFKGVPVKIDGYINLSKKFMDIHIGNINPISAAKITEQMAFKKSDVLKFNADIDYHILGNLKRPKLSFNVDLNDLYLNQIQLPALSFKVNNEREGYKILSGKASQVEFSGSLNEDALRLKVRNFPFDFSSFSINKAVDFNLSFDYRNPLMHLHIDDLDSLSIYGFGVTQLGFVFDIKKHGIEISTANVLLHSGQNLLFRGDYSYSSNLLEFYQVSVFDGQYPQPNPFIRDMNLIGKIQFLNQRWRTQITSTVSGNGANYQGVYFDSFDLTYLLDNDEHKVELNKVDIGQGQLFGELLFKNKRPSFVALNFDGINLKRSRPLFKVLDDYEFAGTLRGKLTYNTLKNSQINADFKIDDFQTILGQFGNLDLRLVGDNSDYNLHQFSLSKIHNLDLKGRIKNNGAFEISQRTPGQIRLESIELFSKLGLRGLVSLTGEFKGQMKDFSFDGQIESQQLEYNEFKLDQLRFDGLITPKALVLRHSDIRFDQGAITTKGRLDYNLSDDQFLIKDYSVDMHFDRVNLDYLSQLYFSFSNVNSTIYSSDKQLGSVPVYEHEYHKYKADNFENFQYLNQLMAEVKSINLSIQGTLNGLFKVSNTNIWTNEIDIEVKDFNYKDEIVFNRANLKSAQISMVSEKYRLNVDALKLRKKHVPFVGSDIIFNPKQQSFLLKNLEVHFRDRVISDSFGFQYNYSKDKFLSRIQLRGDDIALLSLPFPAVKNISNLGEVNFVLEGPLNDIKLVSADVDFNQFRLDFDPEYSALNSAIFVNQYRSKAKDGYFYMHDLNVLWKGEDTFRRVTRDEKTNPFLIKGSIGFKALDLTQKNQFVVDYDLALNNAFFSINFPKFYSGDVIAQNVSFVGSQAVELSKAGKQQMISTLRTNLEKGPVLKGDIILRDGLFNVPKLALRKSRPRVLLDLNTTIAEGNYIQGSLIGDGVYNLATNVSLEIDEKMANRPFKVQGSLNAPQFSTEIRFYEGSIAILDGVYEVLSRDQQAYFFKEVPEFISDHYVQISPIIEDDKNALKTTIHLRAMRKNDTIISTENIRNDQLKYKAIGLAIDGRFKHQIPQITVFDFEIDNMFSLYPSYELYGNYEIRLGNQTILSEASYYGLNLLMPEVISNSEGTSFSNYGRQRINTYIKSSIRPYERRLAKRIGLYDFRINYDFGKTILSSDADAFQQDDLLGLQFVSDLFEEKMFLSLRTDMNLSSDYSNDNARGMKITQVDFTYYFQPNFSIGLKNVNEYSEVTLFDPRWSLNYGYSF